MDGIRMDGTILRVRGRETMLRSGEIQYFRIYRHNWEERLRQARDNHLNAVASYIPWDFHEPEEGRFDFAGETLPERDLVGFLELLSKNELYFIAKPGPFINSEYVDGGHPRWMYERYPETASRRADGQAAFWVGQGNHIPTQLGDCFLGLAERWYAEVIPLLAAYSVEKGGPVILHQPDNEMNLLFTCLDPQGSLYDEAVLGNGATPGAFQRELLDRYGSVEALRLRYDQADLELPSIVPHAATGSPEGDRRKYLDWMKFRVGYVYRYALTLARWSRKYGLTVPNTFNEPINGFFRGPGNHAGFANYMKERGEDVLTTCHTYLRYGYHMDANGLPKTIFRLEAAKMQAADRPAIAIEVGGGWMTLDAVPNYANYPVHLRVLLGHGMDGFNYFIFASGEKGFSRTYVTDAYDLFADPVGNDGKPHAPVYDVTQAFNFFVRQWEPELAGTRKAYDVVIGLTEELYLMASYAGKEQDAKNTAIFEDNASGASSVSGNRAATVVDGIEALTKVLTRNNVQFAVMNLDHPNREPGFDELLIVPNDGALSPAAFAYLEEHAERRGRVAFYPEVPVRDADGEARTGIAEEIGYRVKRRVPRFGMKAGDIGRRFMTMPGLDGVPADRVNTFELPEGATPLMTFEGETSAYRSSFRNGEAAVFGFAPEYTGIDNVTAWRRLLLPFLACERRCGAIRDRFHVAARSGPRMTLAAVVNMTGTSESDTIVVATGEGAPRTFPTLSKLRLAPLAARLLPVNVRLPYGVLLAYSTSELVPLDAARRRWQATGDPGTEGEIAFDRPVTLRIDGRALSTTIRDSLHIAVYEHGVTPLVIEVVPAEPEQGRGSGERVSTS